MEVFSRNYAKTVILILPYNCYNLRDQGLFNKWLRTAHKRNVGTQPKDKELTTVGSNHETVSWHQSVG